MSTRARAAPGEGDGTQLEPVTRSSRRARARSGCACPACSCGWSCVRPVHVSERLTAYGVDKQAAVAAAWARTAREADPEDAVALLGSEQAVQDYIEGKTEQPKEEATEDGAKDLFGEPLPPKQKRLF